MTQNKKLILAPILVCGVALIAFFIVIFKWASNDPYKKGYEIANYEITYSLTGTRDTIEIKTPIDANYQMRDPNIWIWYSSNHPNSPINIYVNDTQFFGLQGLGNVRKLNIITLHRNDTQRITKR